MPFVAGCSLPQETANYTDLVVKTIWYLCLFQSLPKERDLSMTCSLQVASHNQLVSKYLTHWRVVVRRFYFIHSNELIGMQVLSPLSSLVFTLLHSFMLHFITFHFIDTSTVRLFTRRHRVRGELPSTLFNIFPLQAFNYIGFCISKLSDNVLSCSLEKAELSVFFRCKYFVS